MDSSRYVSRFHRLVTAVILLAGPFLAPQVTAQTGKSLTSLENICLAEAQRAEAKHGIPAGLLQSITRVESGRKTVTGDYMPWAWTLNDRGKGLFFDDRDAALTYLRDAVATPGHSVDVGCMQVNTKWHAEGFLDIADMLDPVHNASYAAGFLLDLHAAHQSWDEAVKHYHSAEPRKNVVYHRRVLAELERFMADGGMTPAAPHTAEAVAAIVDPVDSIADPIENSGNDPLAASAQVDSTELALVTRAPVSAPEAPLSQSDTVAPASARMTDAPLAETPTMGLPTPVLPNPGLPTSGALDHGMPETGAAEHGAAERGAAERGAAESGLSEMDAPNTGQADSTGRADDTLLSNQPNLAPHRSRVEHFRRLLAQQAG